MAPSAPPPRAKLWFPYVRLSLFLLVFSTSMYFILEAFNPHIDRNPAEWEPPDKTKKVKQIEWMLKLMKQKTKTNDRK